MNALSPWAVLASSGLAAADKPLKIVKAGNFQLLIVALNDGIWIKVEMPNGGIACFRCAYSPLDLKVSAKKETALGIELKLETAYGIQKVKISVDQDADVPVLRYTTTLLPMQDLTIPYWPKDVLLITKNGKAENTTGKIHASQFGTRTGFIYLTQTRPQSSSILYLQNLTAISKYCDQTETSLGDSVGGEWPELGFSLPVTKKPLQAGGELIICDAFVAFDEEIPRKRRRLPGST